VSDVDLNCDLGESRESIEAGRDAAILRWVTSANVACGGHAGDETTMTAIVRAAAAQGVAVGAHPSFPDRDGFGRVELDMPPATLEDLVAVQIETLGRIARAHGVDVAHVKPHGALYHAAMRRVEIAEVVARAARRWSRGLLLVGQAGAPTLGAWRDAGFRVVGEGFADRRYEGDGSLRSRSLPGALITEPSEAAAQALRLARDVRLEVGTICLHADTPAAPEIARAVREGLAAGGFVVRPPGAP